MQNNPRPPITTTTRIILSHKGGSSGGNTGKMPEYRSNAAYAKHAKPTVIKTTVTQPFSLVTWSLPTSYYQSASSPQSSPPTKPAPPAPLRNRPIPSASQGRPRSRNQGAPAA